MQALNHANSSPAVIDIFSLQDHSAHRLYYPDGLFAGSLLMAAAHTYISGLHVESHANSNGVIWCIVTITKAHMVCLAE